ncbi:radical SAM protein [Bdellovibrionota bacterium]
MRLNIEVTNICPLPCHDDDRDRQHRPLGLMSLPTFRAVINQSIHAGVKSVDIGGAGEPLLHPRLGDFISYLSRHTQDVTTRLVSNGLLLSPSLFKQFKKEGLSSVVVILSPQHLPLSQPNSGSEKARLLDNLATIGKESADLQIIHANQAWSTEEKLSVRKFWAQRGIPNVGFSHRLACGVVLRSPDKKGHRPPSCNLYSHQHYVSWDGKLLSCCHDRSGETENGNFTRDNLRNLIEKKTRIIERQYFYSICYSCQDERRFPKRGTVGKMVNRLVSSIFS